MVYGGAKSNDRPPARSPSFPGPAGRVRTPAAAAAGNSTTPVYNRRMGAEMPVRRYKEGFERLGMVAFVVIAVVFGFIRFAAGPYDAPPDSTEQGRAVKAEIARECDEGFVVFAYLCRERVVAKYRWRHERGQAGMAVIGIVVVIAAFICYRTYPWVRDGFRAK